MKVEQLELIPAPVVVDLSTVRINAPFEHPILGPMWITKKRLPTFHSMLNLGLGHSHV